MTAFRRSHLAKLSKQKEWWKSSLLPNTISCICKHMTKKRLKVNFANILRCGEIRWRLVIHLHSKLFSLSLDRRLLFFSGTASASLIKSKRRYQWQNASENPLRVDTNPLEVDRRLAIFFQQHLNWKGSDWNGTAAKAFIFVEKKIRNK